jgi:hypothetical protein
VAAIAFASSHHPQWLWDGVSVVYVAVEAKTNEILCVPFRGLRRNNQGNLGRGIKLNHYPKQP